MKNIEIAIIGAGPAGLGAAVELKRLGYKDVVVFDREDEAGGTPRHCGHLGFGIFEFKRVLLGSVYAKRLVQEAKQSGVKIELKSTLIKIEDEILTFSTPNGVVQYRAKCTLLALGARETPRPDRLVSGIRSPNIITTGTLQRFAYMQELQPFKKAVVIGSEIVGFSALMSAKHAGIEVKAVIEQKSEVDSFCFMKYLTSLFLGVPVHTNSQLLSINGEDKKVSSVTIRKNGIIEDIECDGVVFSGQFTPESSIMQKFCDDFNYTNHSLNVSQNFQTKSENIFVAGNALRGALAGFKCYFEGKKVAKSMDNYIRFKHKISAVDIVADEHIAWYYPTFVDIKSPLKGHLTTLRLKKRAKGEIVVKLNERTVYKKSIKSYPFMSINIPWKNIELKDGDMIKLEFVEV